VSESAKSGIFVVETPGGEDPIKPQRELITAFVGPTPRGPAHCPVLIRSIDDYLKRFGVPGQPCVMGGLLTQFFRNGGQSAHVLRIPGAARYGHLQLPGAAGTLLLVAANPGPHEFLRAAVDHEGLGEDDFSRFNLVIQRLPGPASMLVEAQEVFRALSVDPDDESWVVDVLRDRSELVRVAGDPPGMRPLATVGRQPGCPEYVYCELDHAGADTISDYDLIGSISDGCGLHALDQLPVVDLICLVPGAPGREVGPVALFAAERYCRQRHALLLLDPPGHWQEPADVLRSQREHGFASASVVTYFPRLDPFGDSAALAAGGSALGALAAWLARAPSAEREAMQLRSRARPAFELEAREIRSLSRVGVNALSAAGSGQLSLHGRVTLAGSSARGSTLTSLMLRQRVLLMLGDIARGTRWTVLQPATDASWKRLKLQLSAYLDAVRDAGLLAQGAEAWFLERDDDPVTGLPALILGLALGAPGEYTIFHIRHEAGGCRISEPGWDPGMALAG